MAFEFTDENFEEAAIKNEGVVVVDFWAQWCGPCKLLTPIIEELSEELKGKALVGKANIDNSPQLSFKYKVRSIPTILILKNGEVVDRQVGLTTKQSLEEKINAAMAN